MIGTWKSGLLALVMVVACVSFLFFEASADQKQDEEHRSRCEPLLNSLHTMSMEALQKATTGKDLVLRAMEVGRYAEVQVQGAGCYAPESYWTLREMARSISQNKTVAEPVVAESHGVLGAVVGGVLMGPVGAVAGAIAGK